LEAAVFPAEERLPVGSRAGAEIAEVGVVAARAMRDVDEQKVTVVGEIAAENELRIAGFFVSDLVVLRVVAQLVKNDLGVRALVARGQLRVGRAAPVIEAVVRAGPRRAAELGAG